MAAKGHAVRGWYVSWRESGESGRVRVRRSRVFQVKEAALHFYRIKRAQSDDPTRVTINEKLIDDGLDDAKLGVTK